MCAQCKKLIEIHNGELAHRGRTFLFCCSAFFLTRSSRLVRKSSEQLYVKPGVFNIHAGNEDFFFIFSIHTHCGSTENEKNKHKFKLHQRKINTKWQKTLCDLENGCGQVGYGGQSSVTCRVTSRSISLLSHICLLSSSDVHPVNMLTSQLQVCVLGARRNRFISSSFPPQCSRTRGWKRRRGDQHDCFVSVRRVDGKNAMFFCLSEKEEKKTAGVQGFILFECSNFFHWHSTRQRHTRLLRLQRGEQNSPQFCFYPRSEQFC